MTKISCVLFYMLRVLPQMRQARLRQRDVRLNWQWFLHLASASRVPRMAGGRVRGYTTAEQSQC